MSVLTLSLLPGVSAVHRLIGLLFVVLSVLAVVQPVSADAGDTIATLLGVGRPLTVPPLYPIQLPPLSRGIG